MINKIAKYTLLLLLLSVAVTVASLTFSSDFRRYTFFRIIALNDFYQLKSLVKYVDGGRYLVECEVWIENSSGERTICGTALVGIPAKTG